MAGYSVTFTVVDNATKQIETINKRIMQMRAPMERQAKAIQQFVDVSGLGKVATGFTSIGRAVEGTVTSMLKMVPVLGTLTGGAAVAGVIKMTSAWASWSRQMEMDADRVGTSAKNLQQWEDAARLAGASADDMKGAMTGLTDSTRDAFVNAGEARAEFNRAGISLTDASGKLRSAADLMPEVIKYLEGIKNPADRARIATAMLGGSGEKLIETFRTAPRTLSEYLAEAGRLPGLTDQQRTALANLNEEQNRFGVRLDHFTQILTANLAPAMTKMLHDLADWLDKNQVLISQDIATVMTDIADAVKWIATHIQEVKIAMEALAGLWVASKLLSIASAFVKIGEGVAGIVKSLRDVPEAAKTAEEAMGTPGAAGGLGAGLLGKIGIAAFLMADVYSKWSKLHTEGFKPEDVPVGSPLETPEQKLRPRPKSFFEEHILPLFGGGGGGATKSSMELGGGTLNLPTAGLDRASAIRDRLTQDPDLQLSKGGAAGLVGNLLQESPNISGEQEKNPIGGGRGGIGWAQWTGPRRADFEAYQNANPKMSWDELNYSFLKRELRQPENAEVLAKLRRGDISPGEAADVVEHGYERPAAGSSGRREAYAGQVYRAEAPPVPTPAPTPGATAPPVAATPTPTPGAATTLGAATLAAIPGAAATIAAATPAGVPANTNAPGASVDGTIKVEVKHVNPPPGASVTATSTGPITVEPPRTERQQLAEAA